MWQNSVAGMMLALVRRAGQLQPVHVGSQVIKGYVLRELSGETPWSVARYLALAI